MKKSQQTCSAIIKTTFCPIQENTLDIVSSAFPGGDNLENLKMLDFDTWIMGIVSKMYLIFNGDGFEF